MGKKEKYDLKDLEKICTDWENSENNGDPETHPTYHMDEHPEGFEYACYCRTCGSYR